MNEYLVLDLTGGVVEWTRLLNESTEKRWQVVPGAVSFPAPGRMIALLERTAVQAQAVPQADADAVQVLGGGEVKPREVNRLVDDGDGPEALVRTPGTCQMCHRFRVVDGDRRCDDCAGRTR